MNNLKEKLDQIIDKERVLVDEPMMKHTTFRVGGPADYFVMPTSAEEVKAVISLCKEEEVPYTIIGNGSNLLVGDKGIRGVVVQLFKSMNQMELNGNVIKAQAGCSLAQIANAAAAASLTGFEFAAGIPGTLGGAVVMNAGAYGGEMKDVLVSATVLDEEGNVETLSAEELELGYRRSIFNKKNYILLDATMELKEGNEEEIRAYMMDLRQRRVDKQPLEFPSAGSTFKRPEGYFAGKLIQDAGLAGFTVGGAQVSAKHCGFVINAGGATAADIVELMKQVSDKVEELNGIPLEAEVKMVGEF